MSAYRLLEKTANHAGELLERAARLEEEGPDDVPPRWVRRHRARHVPFLQTSPSAQSPQLPLQPSPPHSLPAHEGVQGS